MISPVAFSRRIPKWVILNAFLSSISCNKATIQFEPKINDNTPHTPVDSEEKIQSLRRNKLCPDNLIKVLRSSSCDVNSALKVFKWAALQKGFYHNSDTYYWMILKLGLAGNIEEMEGVCQNMVKAGCFGTESALVSLIYSFVRDSRLSEAMRILANMVAGGYKPSVDVFNYVMAAIVEAKRGVQEGVFMYKEMVKAGVLPTVDTLNYMLDVLFEAGKVDSALSQYRRMNRKGCSPNSKTFEIVIKGLIVYNQADDAVIVLREMLELGCPLELSFYTCIIPLFCRENKLEEGIRLFMMMRASDFVPCSFVYEALIKCLCKNLRLDDAVKVTEDMALGSCLTPITGVTVDVVDGFCKLGKIDEAIKFLEHRQVLEASPYYVLLQAYIDDGKFFEAKDLLQTISKRNIADCDSWNILIRWLCEKAELRKAHELLSGMITSSLVPDSSTYSALVIGNCRSSKYEDAWQLFLQLRVRCWSLDSVSYSELVEGLCRAEKYPEAVEVFWYMSAIGCSLQSSSFNMLVKGICDTGMVNEAIKVQLLAYKSGNCCTNVACNCIMLGLSKSQRRKDLLIFLSQMMVEGCNLDAEAYCILIQSMIAQNQIRDCAFFFNLMVKEGLIPNAETLYDLLSFLANHSKLYLISNATDRLVSDFEVLDSAMYNVLVNGLWKEGYRNEACRLLDLMLENGWVPDATTHRLLIRNVDREEEGKEWSACESCTIRDDVSDILAEGLMET